MQEDFHYYATYCASVMAGFTHEESLAVCYSAQFVDVCSRTLLKKIGAPLDAATTQLQMELMNARTDLIGRQDITRIWSSFHFLPADLYSPVKGGKLYKDKFHLVCGPNGELVKDTVELAKKGSLQAVGIAMHILADTWAHRCFAGTPSLVINNANSAFYEITEDNKRKKIKFHENVKAGDDIEQRRYIRTVYHAEENSVMNLGHGRAGHLPDYSFARYVYMPAWGGYREFFKDNPSEYYLAFSQMVYAMNFIRGNITAFEKNTYDTDIMEKYGERIKTILKRRQPNAGMDWKKLGEELTGKEMPAFDIKMYQKEYSAASEKDKTATDAGRFFAAAKVHKSMVTDRIFDSGNLLAGFSKKIGGDGS